MKGKWRWAAAIAVLGMMAVPSTGWAAGFSTYVQSATSTGMASTGTANPDEPNATFFNPAMMPFQDTFVINAGPTFIIPNTTFESADGSINNSTEEAIFPPPNGHVHYKITDDLAVGVGAELPWGLAVSWPDDWVGRETIQFQQLRTLNVTPAVSYKIPGIDLSFAGGAQIVASSIELDRRVILREDTEVQTNLGGNGIGFGGLAAVVYRPTEDITIGANYRSSVKVDYEGRAHFEGEEGTPFAGQFVDGNVTTDLTLPNFVALGFGWQINRLFLELDLNYTAWRSYDELVVDFEENRPSETETITNDWNDAGAIRFGAEYEVIDRLPVRLGLAYDMTPIPDETVSPSLPGNDRAVASVGVGYTFDFGLRVDGAYQLVAALERTIDQGVVHDGDYQTTAHILGLNVGYSIE